MEKSKSYGLIGSALSLIILFLILLFVVIPMGGLEPVEDEGIVVSFGETEEGSGRTEMPASKPVEVPAYIPPKQVKPVKQDLMTQTDNSFAIAEQKKKDEQRKEQQIIERQRIESERIQAEQNKKRQDAIDKANSAMNGKFGNINSSGSGPSTGDTPKGNPAGKGTSNGNSWSLEGRDLKSTLIKPRYVQDDEGQITIEIRVDKDGYVIGNPKAIPKTTISDRVLINSTIEVAKKVKFSTGEHEVVGSIVYKFKNY